MIPGVVVDTVPIVALSLAVSGAATVLAGLVGVPAGLLLAMAPVPGRRAIVLVANAFLGLPPIVVGLALYLVLSRQGPLGGWGLLFTPAAMVAAQAVLATPIVLALTHRAAATAWRDYGDALRLDGASRARAMPVVAGIARPGVITALLAGFGRTVSEVGAILIVGGNIAGSTRTMTTAIALETTRGDLPLALTLGGVLVALSLVVNGLVFRYAFDKEDR